MTRDALLVFAKRPVPGRVKTRMTPPLDAAQAAALYAAMLADVLETSAAFARAHDLAALLYVDPPDACPALARDAPANFGVVAQHGRDLASRMTRAVAETFAAGRRRVLLRGSDSPALDVAYLAAAVAALARADVVLGPDLDGGYSLVGLSRPAPGLFEHPMSTVRVLEDTRARARRDGLRVALLEPRFDLDTADDLRHLAALRVAGGAGACPRTLAWLDRHALWPQGRAPRREA